jgi:serine/threonine-protein kinase
VDHRADVYALGVLAYEVLTGTLPIVATTPVATLVAHQTRVPEAPSARRPGLPPAVDAIVLAALAKRPEDRPASMEALAAALATAGGGPAPRTPPPRRASRPGAATVALRERPAPRGRALRAALAVAGAAVLLALAAARWARAPAERAAPPQPVAAAPAPPPAPPAAAAPPAPRAPAAPAATTPARHAPGRPARRAARADAPAAERHLDDPYGGGGLKPDPFE